MHYFDLKNILAEFPLEMEFERNGPVLIPTWEDQVISYNYFVPVH